jgi:ATP-binding cassette, subfamily B, multidrug efflux pump
VPGHAERPADPRGRRLGHLALECRAASLGVVAAASALSLRLNAMTGWIMWALSSFFRNLGVIEEGMQTIAQPITLVDGAAPNLNLTRAGSRSTVLTHHYGRGSGGLDSSFR